MWTLINPVLVLRQTRQHTSLHKRHISCSSMKLFIKSIYDDVSKKSAESVPCWDGVTALLSVHALVWWGLVTNLPGSALRSWWPHGF